MAGGNPGSRHPGPASHDVALAGSYENADKPVILRFAQPTIFETGCKSNSKLNSKRGDLFMKVAAITADGQTISQHFGRAPYYMVVTVENGKIVKRELRSKLGHAHFADQLPPEEQPGQPHGMDAASHKKHLQMTEAIADCEALLCRGMGKGAYESMQARGIRPVVTDIAGIDDAVVAYVAGNIVDRVDKLH
jgi:predicted Fe-Mo cluster-binding NifX family protein